MLNITDNLDELFDIVDEDDQVIGQATRGEVHRNKKLIHRSVGVCVFNSKGELFLQKRSQTKDTDPGKWTISCSGHVCAKRKDQSAKRKVEKASFPADSKSGLFFSQNLSVYEKAADRELREELGVNLIELYIEPVCKYLCRAPNETEMVMLFKAYSEGPFKLHPQEIEEGKFYTQKELKEALRKKKIELSYMGKVALKKIGWI